jgi:hypothetical protein
VETLSRRELFRRIARVAVAGPVILATSESQAGFVYRLAQLFGRDSALGRWLLDLYIGW